MFGIIINSQQHAYGAYVLCTYEAEQAGTDNSDKNTNYNNTANASITPNSNCHYAVITVIYNLFKTQLQYLHI